MSTELHLSKRANALKLYIEAGATILAPKTWAKITNVQATDLKTFLPAALCMHTIFDESGKKLILFFKKEQPRRNLCATCRFNGKNIRKQRLVCPKAID